MAWRSLCFHPKSAGDNSSSCPPAPIADAPQLERRQGRPPKSSCVGETMAPLTRSRSKASGKKLDVEEGGTWAKLGRNISTRRKSKRVRKDDAELNSVTKEDASDIEGHKCGICDVAVVENSFVIRCGHVFCGGCLKHHFDRLIDSQMSKEQLTVEDVLQRLPCPNESCEEEIKLIELVNIVGLHSVHKYEAWLISIFDRFYGPSVKKSRIDCSTPQSTHEDQQTVVSTNNLLELPTAQVRKALQVRGAGGKYFRKSCVRELFNMVGMVRLEDRAAWVCTCCDLSWCAACGSHLSVIRSKRDRSKVHDVCLGEQRYNIYKSLVELGEAIEAFTQAKQNPVKKGMKAGGPVYTVWADGTGYGGEHVESRDVSDNMQAAVKRAELEFDRKVEKQLAFLTDVLSTNADDKPGKEPALTVASYALIRRENILSRLLQQLAQNDSMLDISERSGLYLKMVSLLGAMEMHVELRSLLTGHPPQNTAIGMEAPVPSSEVVDDCVVDKDSTFFGKLGNIYKQAKVMLQNMPQPDQVRRKKAEAERSLAGELCKCYESLERTVSMQSAPLVADDGSSAAGSQRAITETEAAPIECGSESPRLEISATNYKEALKKVQFRQLSMTNGKGEYVHTYKDHISGKVSSSAVIDKRGIHNHKRMIHLSKEVASLATTLPLEWDSSIHLCVDECRLDVMRALIIGPQGTPYQNGMFLFDIFLPPDYPMVPPFVHFLTTGGGKVRFNPNLYNNGKICLSLLGTWTGPGWVGGKSTLLQVLVSIQSLVFVKEPFYNEPGFESRASPESEKENTRYREHTLSLAVLAALRKPDPLFADIARKHFRFKRKEVENQCDEWVAATTDGYAKQRIANIARDVKQELQCLCS